jgi:hypothetical protein
VPETRALLRVDLSATLRAEQGDAARLHFLVNAVALDAPNPAPFASAVEDASEAVDLPDGASVMPAQSANGFLVGQPLCKSFCLEFFTALRVLTGFGRSMVVGELFKVAKPVVSWSSYLKGMN